MADGYRFPQQSAGSYYNSYPQHPQPQHPRHQITRHTTPPNNIRPSFNTGTPSPTRSPTTNSPAQNLYGMFNQHQGQHGRVNGGPNRQGMPMMFNFQHQNSHQQQHNPHHGNLPQDHSNHASNGLGHHASFSSGVLSNSSPAFTPGTLHNGHSGTTRGGQALQINEHWAEQLKQHKESEKIHQNMMEQGQPNHFARTRATENRSTTSKISSEETEDDGRGMNRMADSAILKRRQDWVNLDLSGQGLRVIAPALFNFNFLTELYISSNNLKFLPHTVGSLRHLRHLDASNNKLAELPPELGLCVGLENLFLFDNKLRTLPDELGSLYKLKMLGIEGNKDLNPEIRQEIMDKGTVALITRLREEAPEPNPPTPREYIELHAPAPEQETFKVFSFNILANTMCTQKMYGYSPAEALSWEYRRARILGEIQSQDADIVCLQEIEKDAFEEYFMLNLSVMGYKGVFFQRTRARTMQDELQKTVDGCATFYKKDKFDLLHKHGIELGNMAFQTHSNPVDNEDLFNRIMARDHIGLLTFLENRKTGSRVMVANTHIFWDPAYADVKLIQVATLMQNISKQSEKYAKWPALTDKKTYGLAEDRDPSAPPFQPAPSKEYDKSQLPLILCCDLNSPVGTGVYQLLSEGAVKPDHPELKGYKYGDYTKTGIDHPFIIRSAYTNLDKTAQAVPFTNYVPTFQGVIDHIWYSTTSLDNTHLLGKVDQQYMLRVPGFPNYHFPSDHLSLVAGFAVKNTSKGKKSYPAPDYSSTSNSNSRRGDRRFN